MLLRFRPITSFLILLFLLIAATTGPSCVSNPGTTEKIIITTSLNKSYIVLIQAVITIIHADTIAIDNF